MEASLAFILDSWFVFFVVSFVLAEYPTNIVQCVFLVISPLSILMVYKFNLVTTNCWISVVIGKDMLHLCRTT